MTKNQPKKQNPSSKKQPPTLKKNLLLATLITLGLILLFIFWPGDLRQYPLGPKDKLEYIGYEAGGCPQIILLGFCDSKPYKTLYYATDMTPEEVVGYFGKLKYEETPWDGGGGDGNYRYSSMHFTNGEEDVVVGYYEDIRALDERGLESSEKKHAIKLDSKKYDLFKKALIY